MSAAAALAWGGRAVPLWMQKLYRWGGATSRTNPFRGPRATKPGSFKPVDRKFGPVKPEMGPPRPMMDKGGLFFRNPKTTFWGAAAGGPIAAGQAYGLLSGDDKPAEETTGPSAADIMRAREQAESDSLAEKQPSMSAGHRTAYLKKRDKRLKKGMKQLLNQYMIIAAVAPEEADNFLKAGMKMMEADQEFKDDIYNQDIYDTIFQPGNMPGSGREAYQMLIQEGLDSKEAMKVAGDYHDLVPEYKEWQYKKKEDIKMDSILRMPRDKAIQTLISAWASDTFNTPENLKHIDPTSPEGRQKWIEYADATLDLMQSGGGGATSSGQILSDTKRS